MTFSVAGCTGAATATKRALAPAASLYAPSDQVAKGGVIGQSCGSVAKSMSIGSCSRLEGWAGAGWLPAPESEADPSAGAEVGGCSPGDSAGAAAGGRSPGAAVGASDVAVEGC